MDLATLIDALRRLTEGETVIDPTIVTQVMRRRRPAPVAELTERELDVLALVAEGLSNQAIATRLVINERTVETHTTRIFTKLGLAQSPASAPPRDGRAHVLAVMTGDRASVPARMADVNPVRAVAGQHRRFADP